MLGGIAEAVALGAMVGAILGLTGAGGSILAVPFLMFGLGWTLPQAAPVALLAVCAAAAFGTIAAWDAAYVRHRAAMVMAIGSLVTAPLGVELARNLPAQQLSWLFAAVLVFVATKMFVQAWRRPSEAAVVRAAVKGDEFFAQGRLIRLDERGRVIWTGTAAATIGAIGAFTGFVAGLLGVGGGFVIVPALRATSQLSMHSIVATSLLAIALISGSAVAGILLLQGVDLPWREALPFVGGALGGMLLGRKLAPRIAGPRLQQLFAVLMFVVAAGLVASAARGF